MSKKLNKKLVFVVGSLVLILGVVGMISLVMVQGNTERHIRAGDEFMEAKEYRKAADTYGRAVAKKATKAEAPAPAPAVEAEAPKKRVAKKTA